MPAPQALYLLSHLLSLTFEILREDYDERFLSFLQLSVLLDFKGRTTLDSDNRLENTVAHGP